MLPPAYLQPVSSGIGLYPANGADYVSERLTGAYSLSNSLDSVGGESGASAACVCGGLHGFGEKSWYVVDYFWW